MVEAASAAAEEKVEIKLERGMEAKSVEEDAEGKTEEAKKEAEVEGEDPATLEEEATGAAVLDEGAGEPEEHTPVAAREAAATPGVGVSPARVQPDFSVNSLGQATTCQLTDGLSAP